MNWPIYAFAVVFAALAVIARASDTPRICAAYIAVSAISLALAVPA